MRFESESRQQVYGWVEQWMRRIKPQVDRPRGALCSASVSTTASRSTANLWGREVEAQATLSSPFHRFWCGRLNFIPRSLGCAPKEWRKPLLKLDVGVPSILSRRGAHRMPAAAATICRPQESAFSELWPTAPPRVQWPRALWRGQAHYR